MPGWPRYESFVIHFNKLNICTDSLGKDRPLYEGHLGDLDPSLVPLPDVDDEILGASDWADSLDSRPITEDSDS